MPEITIHDILAQFREEELHNRLLGDRFERLIARYLQLDPLFADRFSNVWMWNEWPMKGHTGDTGIDLVAEERATGEFCAIQCKFYLPDHTLSQSDVDSFFAALGNAKFSSGLFISTTDKWGANAEEDEAEFLLSEVFFRATTSAKALGQQHPAIRRHAAKSKFKDPTVVFSTCRSIASVADADKAALPDFYLIICEEAHRITGAVFENDKESNLIKIHNAACDPFSKILILEYPTLFAA